MQNQNNHRRGFLKSLTIAIGSFVIFSGFKFKKSNPNTDKAVEPPKFKTLSKDEADAIIKNENSSVNVRLNPEPAPIKNNGK